MPVNTSEKRSLKIVECKSEKDERCKELMEDEEALPKEKEASGESCAMWKGVLDTIDKNMV